MTDSNPPKAPLDIVDDALDELYWETANRPVKGIDENNTDELDVIMTHKRQIIDEAKVQIEAHIQREVRTAELRARIDEIKRKMTLYIERTSPQDYRDGFYAALDQIDKADAIRISELEAQLEQEQQP
jgi:hypothetical protein